MASYRPLPWGIKTNHSLGTNIKYECMNMNGWMHSYSIFLCWIIWHTKQYIDEKTLCVTGRGTRPVCLDKGKQMPLYECKKVHIERAVWDFKILSFNHNQIITKNNSIVEGSTVYMYTVIQYKVRFVKSVHTDLLSSAHISVLIRRPSMPALIWAQRGRYFRNRLCKTLFIILYTCFISPKNNNFWFERCVWCPSVV